MYFIILELKIEWVYHNCVSNTMSFSVTLVRPKQFK